MNIDVPLLRLGLAGFDERQQQDITEVAQGAMTPRSQWRISGFADADAWLLDGSRTQMLAADMLRVNPGVPMGRPVQLSLADVDRPVAFGLPLAPAGFAPALTFDLKQRDTVLATLHKFTAWLEPMIAQYALAASIADHQPALGSGSWEVLHGAEVLAVVGLSEGTAVSPRATSLDFADASWCIRDHGAVEVPANFVRTSVSQLMWQYALRTRRDLLPPHYRKRPLYFRRPPRLPQRQLKDAHLLLLRELSLRPGTGFEDLLQLTGLDAAALAHHLAGLYFVGAITANPKRAGDGPRRDSGGPASLLPSVLESGAQPLALTLPLRRPANDLTAPAPLSGD